MALTINGIKVAGNGKPGAGVAKGGTSGQILTKKSNTDYDTEWVDIGIPDVSGQITSHNESTEAHADIRAAIPSKTSQLTNDSGYITSYTETDPTVPAWAKAASKPIYTASEVGALPIDTVIPSIEGLATETFVTEQIAAIPEPDLSSKQDKLTGIEGQTVEFNSDGNLVAVDKEATSNTIIRVW